MPQRSRSSGWQRWTNTMGGWMTLLMSLLRPSSCSTKEYHESREQKIDFGWPECFRGVDYLLGTRLRSSNPLGTRRLQAGVRDNSATTLLSLSTSSPVLCSSPRNKKRGPGLGDRGRDAGFWGAKGARRPPSVDLSCIPFGVHTKIDVEF